MQFEITRPALLSPPVFQTVLTLVLYWKEKNRGEYSTDRFPTYKNVGDNVEVYALPSLEYPGHVRVSLLSS